jgi:hypothetical protein
MGDVIREVRVLLSGFDHPKLDGKHFLLKFVNTTSKVSTLKAQLEAGITNHYLNPEAAAGGSRARTLAPANRINLVFKKDVMYEEDTLEHYNFRNKLGQNYAELQLFLDEKAAETAVVETSTNARSAWARAGQKTRQNVRSGWVPSAETSSNWTPQIGAPPPSICTRHHLRRGGTRGLLELMKEHPEHQSSNEEVCWQFLLLASQIEEDTQDWRKRLIKDDALPVVVQALKRSIRSEPMHFGACKQALGLLHYFAKFQDESVLLMLISSLKVIPVVMASVRAARSHMTRCTAGVLERNGPECSVFCDIAELAFEFLSSLQHTPEGRAAFKAEDGEKMVWQWTKTWIVGEEPRGRTSIIDGCPKALLVQDAAEQCIAMSTRKSKKKKKKTKS